MKKQTENNTSETFNPTEYLKGLHTKQLLKLRDKIYQITPDKNLAPKFSSEHEEYLYEMDSRAKYDVSDNFKNWYVTLVQVKRELRTREHVPNKVEAKEIRQQCAKNKMR